jgi:hypothetical protein
MKDLENGYIASSYIFGDVLKIVRLRAIETGDLICRNLYCVFWSCNQHRYVDIIQYCWTHCMSS